MKKNIILIMTDDQTLNTIHCKGNSDVITPNLDKLCEGGTYFSNYHIQGGTSGAICMPSRATTHTSQSMFKLKAAGDSIPSEHNLLGESLRFEGYQTFFTGKWHNGVEGFKRSFSSGDNIFFGGMWDHYNVPMNAFDPSGEYDNKVKMVVNFFESSEVTEMRATKFNPGVHSTDVVTKSAINFLDNLEEDKPFFLNVAYLAPHDPRIVPQKYLDMYGDVDLTSNFAGSHNFDFGQQVERDEIIAPKPLSKEWCQKELKSYYAMITHLDHEIGNIISKLKELELYDDAILVFTSDNGLTLGAHGLMGKQNLYEESIRVPLIIKYPGCTLQENSQFILAQDIFPTLLELIGSANSPCGDGISFANILNNKSCVCRDQIYLAFTDLIRGVKTDRYKLIKYRPESGVEINQLFDLKLDSQEELNLYENNQYQMIKQKMEDKLQELRQQYEPASNNNSFSTKYWSKL